MGEKLILVTELCGFVAAAQHLSCFVLTPLQETKTHCHAINSTVKQQG